MNQSTILIIIKGKVQGVFYRQSTKEMAEKFGVTGSVKNNEDGSVEVIASGNVQQLDQLIEWCRRGPSRAVVTSVETSDLPLQHFTKFSIHKK